MITSGAQLHEKLKSKKQMSVEEIVKKDLDTNYKHLGYGVKNGMAILTHYKEQGADFKRVGNTLFVIMPAQDNVVVYHTVNGDPLKTFLYNCLQFFAYLYEQGYKQALTYFSDPKTKIILEKYKIPNEQITESNDPEQGEFMMTTSLEKVN